MADPRQRPVLFFAFANERGGDARFLRNLIPEANGLRDLFDGAEARELWEPIERRNASLQDVLDVFQDTRYRGRIVLFHFAGHGDSNELQLESADGSPLPTDASTFVTFLRTQQSLRLVFLNACSTQGQVEQLLAAGVPAVVATTRAIDDAVATDFALRFHRGLATGGGLRVSFDEAAASQRARPGTTARDVRRKVASASDDRWPWELHSASGADWALDWRLGDAAGQPLLGLPPLPPGDLPSTPYRHLNWFGREHAQVFFGRGREIRELFERLTSPHTPPITLLYGQSGVGKSSLLAAGLLPRLEGQATCRYVRRTRDVPLLSALQQAVGRSGAGTLSESWHEAERVHQRPLVMVLDQVEEVFTQPLPNAPHELGDVLDALRQLVREVDSRPKGKLLLAFRKEWLAEIEEACGKAQLPFGKVFVDHLDATGVVEAVSGPASVPRLRDHYRLSAEPELAQRIALDLLEDRGSPIAPALQLLLTKLWDRATARSSEAPRLTMELYLQLKREGLLLDDFVEAQLAALSSWRPDLAGTGLVLDVLAQHTTSLGSAQACNSEELRVQYRDRPHAVDVVIAKARELSLLVDAAGLDDTPGAGDLTRLIHDAVAQLVRRRYEQSDLPGQQARRVIERAAKRWSDGRTGALLSESDLATVEVGLPGMRALTPDESRLVDASRVARDEALRGERSAAVVRTLLTSREAADDPLVAALLVAELADHPEPEENIRAAWAALSRPIPAQVRDFGAGVSCLQLSTNGRFLAAGGEDGVIRFWDLEGEEAPVVIRDHGARVSALAFSADGQWFASASRDGTAGMRSMAHPDGPPALLAHSGFVEAVTFSPDSQWIATASTDGTARVCRCDRPEEVFVLRGHTGAVCSVEFGAASDRLLTLDEEGRARIWTMPPETTPRVVNPTDAWIRVGFLGGHDGVGWMSFENKVGVTPLSTQEGWVSPAPAAGFKGEGAVGPVTLQELKRPVEGDARSYASALCTAPGAPMMMWGGTRELYSTGVDGGQFQVFVDDRSLAEVRGEFVLVAAACDHTGSTVLTLWSNGQARLGPPTQYKQLLSHGGGATLIALSSRGEVAATADGFGAIRVWRTDALLPVTTVTLPEAAVTRAEASDSDTLQLTARPRRLRSIELEESAVEQGGTSEWRVSPTATEVSWMRESFGAGVDVLGDHRLLTTIGPRLVVLDERTLRAPSTVANNWAELAQIAWTADGATLVLLYCDGELCVWDLDRTGVRWQRDGIRWFEIAGARLRVRTMLKHEMVFDLHSGDVAWELPVFADPGFWSASGERVDVGGAWESMLLGDGLYAGRWPTADHRWALVVGHRQAGGPSALIWSPVRGGEVPRVLADLIDGEHFAGKDLLIVHQPEGRWRLWSTRTWDRMAPDEGITLDFEVSAVFPAPVGSCALLASNDGMMRMVESGDVPQLRYTIPAAACAWSPDATMIAAYRFEPDAAKPTANVAPGDTTVTTGWWLLEVYRTDDGSVVLRDELVRGSASQDVWATFKGAEPLWADNARVAAIVYVGEDGSAERTLKVWTSGTAGWTSFVVRHITWEVERIWMREDNRCLALAGGDGLRVLLLTDTASPGERAASAMVLDERNASGSAFRPRGTLTSPVVAFGPHDSVACAFERDGVWFAYLRQLAAESPRVALGTGRGTPDRLSISSSGTVDLTLTNGTTLRWSAAGRPAGIAQRPSDGIQTAERVGQGTAIVALRNDGTARLWRTGNSPALLLKAPSGPLAAVIDDAFPYPARGLVAFEPDSTPWIVAKLLDDSYALWHHAGGTLTALDTSRRRVTAIAGIHRYYTQLSSTWLAAALDDGSVRVWFASNPTQPRDIREPGGAIRGLYGSGHAIEAAFEDGSTRRWQVHGETIEERTLTPEREPGAAVCVARLGELQLQRVGDDYRLVNGDRVLPMPAPTEESEGYEGFEFCRSGRWLVAHLTTSSREHLGTRIWRVEDPSLTRFGQTAEGTHLLGEFLCSPTRQSETMVIPLDAPDETFVIPKHATALDHERVVYVSNNFYQQGVGLAVHVLSLRHPHDPVVLHAPGKVRAIVLQQPERVGAALNDGRLVVWDLTWKGLAARVSQTTSATLTPAQRRRLLGEE